MNNKRLVVRFCCGGLMRFLSHQETVTAIERTIRRSGLSVTFTQGFHPRIKVSYSPAIPTGVASLAHYVLLETDEKNSDPVSLLNSAANYTLRALSSWYLSSDHKRIEDFIDSYRMVLVLPRELYDPNLYDAGAEVTKKTKSGQRDYLAGDVFQDISVTTLKTVYMVKYSQPVDSMVPAEEMLKILSKEGTASHEGVIVFVEEGLLRGKYTSNILDEIGGI
ncbi:radical SAM-linked protein [Mesotoga sp. BH458_6_3_2_1]|nr:DUF2344 domain-containing protein [Thermotogaceae bacterium]RLL87493.1 radical SAM-linked protein [Mesotoga sp. BH458_6_3_2_1]